ncbi:ankyrin [Massarina eburnea CBS 473.64]|uniref:Ankyrin n=1 Tax=Massarina eburnea CBS 473.64 TaxID=1395130 RepID=A0A6A6RK93_9PLEO|nr:ankyrin [Massarina eburnea CBS 473.64]
MELLHFPPEIFQNIVHELVCSVGVDKAWKMRGVCRTFAAEIRYDIVTNQTKDSFRGSKVLDNVFDAYLQARMKIPLDINPQFVKFLHDIVDYLSAEKPPSAPDDRDAITLQLCSGIRKFGEVFDLTCHMWSNNLLNLAIIDADRLAAAILTGNLGLVQSIMAATPRISDKSAFGSCLRISVLQGDWHIIEPVLVCIESPRPDSIAPAIRAALRAKKADIVKLLMEKSKHYGVKIHKTDYMSYVSTAIMSGSLKLLKMILRMEIQAPKAMFKRQWEFALENATANMTRALHQYRLIDVHRENSGTTPLIFAVKLGRLKIIQALLDVGAPIDAAMPTKSDHIWDWERTALNIALTRKNTEVVELLLKNGATMPHMETWRRNRPSWNYIRGISLANGCTNVPTLDEFMETYSGDYQVEIPSGPRVTRKIFKRACRKPDPEIVKALLGPGGIDTNHTWSNHTPLTIACETGSVRIVTTVLDTGANINGVEGHSKCIAPIFHTMKLLKEEKGGSRRVIDLLLERGADLKDADLSVGVHGDSKMVRDAKEAQEETRSVEARARR